MEGGVRILRGRDGVEQVQGSPLFSSCLSLFPGPVLQRCQARPLLESAAHATILLSSMLPPAIPESWSAHSCLELWSAV